MSVERSILDGTYPVGSRLPSEQEIARSHGTSRPTVVRAMRWLVAHGLVRRRQGIGTFVTASTSAPVQTRVRLLGSEGVVLRVVDGTPERLVLAGTVGGHDVATVTVHLAGRSRRRTEEFLDWSVLVGDRGWSGYRRLHRTSLVRAAGEVRLLVETDITDEFSERRCRVVAALDPTRFAAEVDRVLDWD